MAEQTPLAVEILLHIAQTLNVSLHSLTAVIELLDARLPGSSANPLLAKLTEGKPTLKLLNKQDLADPERTEMWLAHYNARPATRAIGLDASIKAPATPTSTALKPRGRMITSTQDVTPLKIAMAMKNIPRKNRNDFTLSALFRPSNIQERTS